MQYINKFTNENEGKAIIDDLLNECWDGNKYLDANFETLKQQKFKMPFIELLLKEQNFYCCYCMKEIKNDFRTTLEHIIPNNNKNLDQFQAYLETEELGQNVIDKKEFSRKTKIISPEKYPHDIAYHNLIASCDSNTHCNHFREDKYITAFFFDPLIQSKVMYDYLGIAYSEEYNEDLSTVGITTNEDLRIYRVLWKELSEEFENPNDINEEELEMKIYLYSLNDHLDSKSNKIISNLFGNPSKKEELMKYKRFFYYYKNQIQ